MTSLWHTERLIDEAQSKIAPCRKSSPVESIPLNSIERFLPPAPRSKLRFVIQPILGSGEEIDVTDAVTRAIAQELWNHSGGNAVVNWLEAESHLQKLLDGAARFRRPPFLVVRKQRSSTAHIKIMEKSGAKTSTRVPVGAGT